MYKSILTAACMLITIPAANAAPITIEDVLPEWLHPAQHGRPSDQRQYSTTSKATAQADAARLLTLESKQSEMFPQPSPDGRYMLSLVHEGKHSRISRRYLENGDPANKITDDVRALDSAGWSAHGKVYYLSSRAGGPGLWEKSADGAGIQRRIRLLKGMISQPILLPDESVIAVRMKYISRKSSTPRRAKRDRFNNWQFDGFSSEIVRFSKDGSFTVLAEGINPSLSPDGTAIVFAMPTGRSFHLFRMNTDGSDLVQITDARSVDVQPSWSADGKWIVFTSNRARANMRHPNKSAWDIWAIGTDGRSLTQVTFDKARDGAARMAQNGRIYFHSDRPVSRAQKSERQASSIGSHDFHIWSVAMPMPAGR